MSEENTGIEVIEHTHEEFVDKVRGVRPADPPAPAPEAPATPPAETGVAPTEGATTTVVDPVKTLVTDTTDYKSEYEKVKAELETKNKNPYSNPSYYRLEVLERENAEEAKLYQKLVFGDPDPKELWKIGFKKDHPDASPEQIQRRLEKAYPALFDSTLTAEDPDRRDAEMDLDLEAKRVKRDLMKRFDGIEIPNNQAVADAQKAKNDEIVRNWKPRFEQLATDSKFTLDVPFEGNKEAFEFEIPKDKQGEYLTRAAAYMLTNQLKADPDGYAKVKEFMVKQYIADNHIDLFSAAAKSIAEKRDALWAKKVTNPAPIKDASSTTSSGKMSDEEILAENMARADKAMKQ